MAKIIWKSEEELKVPSPPSVIEVMGQQLVEKEIQILSLQQMNEVLGKQVVDLELRLLSGGL